MPREYMNFVYPRVLCSTEWHTLENRALWERWMLKYSAWLEDLLGRERRNQWMNIDEQLLATKSIVSFCTWGTLTEGLFFPINSSELWNMLYLLIYTCNWNRYLFGASALIAEGRPSVSVTLWQGLSTPLIFSTQASAQLNPWSRMHPCPLWKCTEHGKQ